MRHAVVATIGLAAVAVSAQTPATPAIDAVSIKRNVSGGASSLSPRPGGYAAVNVPVYLFIGLAYPFQGSQIEGAPDWFYDDLYDMTARITGVPTPQQSLALWRAVFAERMQMQAHIESREQAIYALVPERPGQINPNLKRVDTDCTSVDAAPGCTRITRTGVTSRGLSMAALARLIQPTTGRVVVDRTGLAGFFELSLTFSPTKPNAAVDPAPGVTEALTIFTALQEQLGLKLESTRGPVDVLIIDRIERPIVD